jgi:hypothetical protein
MKCETPHLRKLCAAWFARECASLTLDRTGRSSFIPSSRVFNARSARRSGYAVRTIAIVCVSGAKNSLINVFAAGALAPQMGAPRSHQRTWADEDGRSPSRAFCSWRESPPVPIPQQTRGWPISRALCEMWETRTSKSRAHTAADQRAPYLGCRNRLGADAYHDCMNYENVVTNLFARFPKLQPICLTTFPSMGKEKSGPYLVFKSVLLPALEQALAARDLGQILRICAFLEDVAEAAEEDPRLKDLLQVEVGEWLGAIADETSLSPWLGARTNRICRYVPGLASQRTALRADANGRSITGRISSFLTHLRRK